MGEEVQKIKNDAPVKVDEGPKRFVEKGPHVVLDTKTNVFWLKKDSWQDKGKFFNWHEAVEYSDRKTFVKSVVLMTGGYHFLTRLKHCMTNLMITLGRGE